MKTPHPPWCLGTETADEDHVSETLCAAAPTDCADIRLRLEELRDPSDDKHAVVLFIEFTEDNETNTFPLLMPQARTLWDTIGRLLPRAEAEPVSAGA